MSGEKVAKIISRYGLEVDRICSIDLLKCYCQNTPNKPLSRMYNQSRSMIESPHAKIARLYYEHGLQEVKKRYEQTDYCKMKELFGKGKKFPSKMFKLFDSVKKGYLINGYKENFIVVLMESFAISRYNREEENLVPEVWSGHHRVGALIALDRYEAKVVIAKDAHHGEKFSQGKIHKWCRD